MKVIVSAPGKVILHGEHAVVYGKHALAAAINLRTILTLQTTLQDDFCFQVDEFNWNYSYNLKELQELINHLNISSQPLRPTSEDWITLCKFLHIDKTECVSQDLGRLSLLWLFLCICQNKLHEGINIKITTLLPVGAGLGSSASFASCISGAFLFYANSINLPKTDSDLNLISKWAFVSEEILHGKPSGIDNSTIVYGGGILFKLGKIMHIKIPDFRILLVNTRIPRSTKVLVQGVYDRFKQNQKEYERIMDEIEDITIKVKDGFSYGNEYSEMETCVENNQKLLNEMGVGHPTINEVLEVAKGYGFTGKLTGAGGGGCIFIIVPRNTLERNLSGLTKELSNMDCQFWYTDLDSDGIQIQPQI